jgi:RHS repeat-associated protein
MQSIYVRAFSVLIVTCFFISSTLSPVLAAINYTYDAGGNMTSNGTNCYEYNEANQLKKVKKCSNSELVAEYLYDFNGNRLVKKEYENGALKRTVYSPSDEYETKKLDDGTTQNTTYYKLNDEVVAKKNPDGSKNYYHNDHLGSTSILTSQTGTKVEDTAYDPWGEVKTGGEKSKFQYTGQEKDLETGLNYYGARYYDSHIRRFTQADPIIQDVYDPQSLNRYSYVRNNPLKYTDPSGNIWGLVSSILNYASTFLGRIASSSLVNSVANKVKGNPNVAKAAPKVPSIANNSKGVVNTASKPIINSGGSNPTVNGQVLRGAQNPFVKSTIQHGIQTHKTFQYGSGYRTEVTLDSGKRVDALNDALKHIKELKPDNNNAVRKGYKQLNEYLDELNQTKDDGWTGEVVTYPSLKRP